MEGGERIAEHCHFIQDAEKQMLIWVGRNASVRGAPQGAKPMILSICSFDALFVYKQKEKWIVSETAKDRSPKMLDACI